MALKRTLLRWHLGLGDALLCNGLVRVLVERGHHLTLPCWPHNEASVRAMFSELEDKVYVDTQMPEYLEHATKDVISLGHYGKDFDRSRWDESFYRQAGVPFLAKWEKFKLPTGALNVYGFPRYPAVFVHDDHSRGFVIPTKGYRPVQTASILDHGYIIQADEIHCINSSFAILADMLPGCKGKRYLHKYARPDGGALPIFGREWTILDKPL